MPSARTDNTTLGAKSLGYTSADQMYARTGTTSVAKVAALGGRAAAEQLWQLPEAFAVAPAPIRKMPVGRRDAAGIERLPTIVVIPDTQIKPGVPTEHLSWAGRFIADKLSVRPDVTIVHLGDHWDFPSLSSYDKGKRVMEGARYSDDLAAGNAAFKLLDAPISAKANWKPRKVRLDGNHENRRTRAMDDNAQLHGALGEPDSLDWEVIPFLQPEIIHGIHFAHYWYNHGNGRPLTGQVETRLKTLGFSFVQGHQQGLQYGLRPVAGARQQGLVAGSFYQHDETYLGPQATAYWRGIIVLNECRDGMFDPMFVGMDYLRRRYG